MKSELVDIIVQTWEQLTGAEIEPTSLYAVEGFPLAACIHIVGDWQGAAVIVMQHEIARYAASQMFSQPNDDDISEIMVADALGELANIIGGLIKSGLDGQNSLSLPVVVRGGLDLIGSKKVFIQGFETPVGQFEVSLYTHSDEWVDKVNERFR